jgi:hypothetical protein
LFGGWKDVDEAERSGVLSAVYLCIKESIYRFWEPESHKYMEITPIAVFLEFENMVIIMARIL